MKYPFSRTIETFIMNKKLFIMNWFGVIQVGKNVPKSTCFPHLTGVVIGKTVKMGENCIILQGVTIGKKSVEVDGQPILGNNVKIYANSVVVGNIRIGNNVVIGANSVVLKSIPNNWVVAGNPARFIKKVKK